mgnify:CR=1 FL=1
MAKYLLNRIMQTIALLLIVSLLSFFLVSLMPSDPVYAQFGTDITQEEYQVAFVRMGLDKPIIVRYLTWLGNVLKGDFGTSYCYHKGVWEVISGKLGTTLYMAVLSLLLSMPIGILLGTVTAVKRGQWADTIITLFSKDRERIEMLGEVPSVMNRPAGCPFSNRCRYATERCRTETPPMRSVGADHSIACFLDL